MSAYLVMFLWPSFCAIFFSRNLEKISKLMMVIFGFYILIIVGFHFEIGTDWTRYIAMMERVQSGSFWDAVAERDPAYFFFIYIAVILNTDIWLVNLCCCIFFVIGLITFVKRLSNPWLALAVAIPQLTIVWAMTSPRQSAAIGLVMLAMVALMERRHLKCSLLVMFGALFHSSAMVMLPLVLLSSEMTKGRVLLTIIIGSLLSVVLVGSYIDSVLQQYLFDVYYMGLNCAEASCIGQSSGGAPFRVLLCAFAGSIFLVFLRHFKFSELENKIYKALSLASIGLAFLLLLLPTTIIDRFSIYLIPLQLVVFSSLDKFVKPKLYITVCIILSYGMLMLVYFAFSDYAAYGEPYSIVPWKTFPLNFI